MRPGCLRIEPGDLDAEVVADRCWLLGATAIGTIGTRLEVGFATAADGAAAAVALGEWWPGLAVEEVDAGPALDAALDAWKPHARSFRIAPLHIRPAWLDGDDDPPRAGERLVVVDPSRAFGYDHPTTTACLEVIAAHAGPGRSLLDVGCGSGVLAVAAAVLGSAPVLAIDTDPVAVAATAAAAERNGVAVDASCRPIEDVPGTFDLVVANIGAATLIELAPAIAARVGRGGVLALAGMRAERADAVVDAYRTEGLAVTAVRQTDGWANPVFLRKSTTSGP